MNLSRFSVYSALVSALCAVAGCKPAAAPKTGQDQTPGAPSLQTSGGSRRQPSTAELADFVRSNLPPVLKLVDLKNDPPVPLPGTEPGSNAWLYNVRLTFAATEDEFGAPPPQAAQAIQALMDELNGLVAWSQAYAKSPYASLYPGFTVEPPVPTSPQLLVMLHRKGQPHAPIYGKLAAEWQVDHWQFSMQDAALPEEGRFRSTVSGPVLIQGEPVTDRFVAAAKAAIDQAKPKKEAIERRYQENLQKATQSGILYTGQINKGNKSVPVEVRFTTPLGNDPGLARFELRLPASGYVYTCSAKLARHVPKMPVEPTAADSPFTKLVEPAPEGDLTINYERVNSPKFNLANELANDLLYGHSEVKDAPLNLRDHQITGKLTNLPYNFLALSVRQSP